jgi:hypothetical protein
MSKKAKLPYPLPPSVRSKLRVLDAELRAKIIESSGKIVSHPDFVRIILQHPLSQRANELTLKLLTGAQNRRLNRADEPSLDPFRVAQVLAWLADTEPQDMNWVVRQSLSWLGIDRITRLGRPPGRVKDKKYLLYFNEAIRIIEQDQLWEAKQDSRQKYPRNWRLELQRNLKKKGWGPETFEFLAAAPSKRALAIKLVSRRFNTAYDTVAKAVRRHGK